MKSATKFVLAHGVVLETAAGPVPTLAHEIAGETIRGSWWSHSKSHAIHAATLEVRASRDVLTCRAVRGKITFIHRRLWPALVRLAPELSTGRLAAVREIHTPQGKHEVRETPYPRWVPAETKSAAKKLSRPAAIRLLGDWVLAETRPAQRAT